MLDPVITGARPTRNYAYLVFDTLYGIDTKWKARPQMVEGHAGEEDGLTWTLTLRDGLRFHDKEPVLARDVVASIRRFAPRVGARNRKTSSPAEAVNRQGIDSSCCARSAPSLEDPRGSVLFEQCGRPEQCGRRPAGRSRALRGPLCNFQGLDPGPAGLSSR